MIRRLLATPLHDAVAAGRKVVILYGPRQVGKTTLIRQVLAGLPYRSLAVNADEHEYLDVLASRDVKQLTALVSGYEVLFIDEAQRVPGIGLGLKILHDRLPQLRVVVTGSSSFELANRTQEPLTGRTSTHTLYPVATAELAASHNPFELGQLLNEQLLYGAYPEVFGLANAAAKRRYLQELSTAYLYRDVLEMGNLRYPDKLRKLLQLLALQVGSTVSINELSNGLQLSRDAVMHYLDLLEKAFVVFRLSGFSRNLRKEVVKNDKIYFYDLGIRNALLNNFSPLDLRPDAGAIWENFLVIERRKRNAYLDHPANAYFWRTYTGAELAYVEEADGQLAGFAFKLSRRAPKPPATWPTTYPGASYADVSRSNYLEFVL